MPSDLYRSLTEHVPLMEEALKEADEMWKQVEGIGDPNMVALYSRTYTITEELLHLYNTQRETLETETVEGRTLDDELLDLEDTAEQIENLLLENDRINATIQSAITKMEERLDLGLDNEDG